MGSAAHPASLVVIQQGDIKPPASPTLWTPLSEVLEIGDFEINRPAIDVTSHGATIFAEQIAGGKIEPIDVQITMVYEQLAYQTMWNLVTDTAQDGPLEWWRLLYPDTYYHQFEAFVRRISSINPLREAQTFQVNFAVTQTVTYDNS
jgi:hypothetical protein